MIKVFHYIFYFYNNESGMPYFPLLCCIYIIHSIHLKYHLHVQLVLLVIGPEKLNLYVSMKSSQKASWLVRLFLPRKTLLMPWEIKQKQKEKNLL